MAHTTRSRSGFFLPAMIVASWVAAGASADIQIDSAFDSGSIGAYVIDEPLGEIEFTLTTDGTNYTYWTHFEVSGVSGREIAFHITNADDVPFLSDTTHESQLVYSYDGESWFRFTNHSYVGGTYSFSQTFTADAVRIATFFPYSTARMGDLVDMAAATAWGGKTVLGASEQGRDIDLLTLTNPAIPPAEKKVIYIVGRQHAAETSSSHMLQGLIGFLVSDDVYAAGFRDAYVWHIVPLANPDGVHAGNSRANSEGNDPNRDWHASNHDSVEVDIIREHLNAIDASVGIDLFVDWHSQMSDDGWYSFVYTPPGNTIFETLSDWTDFDTEKAVGTSCSPSSCSSRGYTTGQGLFVLVIEPTPHLTSWTEATLRAEGVNTAFAMNEYFGLFEGPLLVDSDFASSADDAALRADGGGPDWTESREDDPGLLTLDTTAVDGNATPKAKLTGSTLSNAYLTQRFGRPQTGRFTVQWDIRVEEILDVPGTNTDRAGWMLLGDDTDATQPGPNSDDAERFVYMAFFRDGGGTIGDSMDLVARDRDDAWSGFTTVATGLTIGEWYTIAVECDVPAGSYRVYVDGTLAATLTSRRAKSSVSHISFAQWDDGAGTFYVDDVMAPGPPVPAVPGGGVMLLVLLLATAGIVGGRRLRPARGPLPR